MNRLLNKMAEDCKNCTNTQKEYDYEKYLNWKDDGDILMDSSMNDYLKGYNIDPYEFKQWASKKGIKTAALEVDVMQFSNEYLADKIITLWNGADGDLQHFFEGFTLRYDNKLKKKLAEILGELGYKVYPVLTDDRPRYAKVDRIKKVVASSKGLSKFAEEIQQLQDSGEEVTKVDAAGMLDYFKQIFPEDYAISLVFIDAEKPEEASKSFNSFNDYSISDEALNQIEDYMSGNADPTYRKDGGQGGYDFTSDMRHDTTAPGAYELRLSKKKQD